MVFQLCVERLPDWPEAFLNAGIAYARCGDPVIASRHFHEALMLRPDSSGAERGLAALVPAVAMGTHRIVRHFSEFSDSAVCGL